LTACATPQRSDTSVVSAKSVRNSGKGRQPWKNAVQQRTIFCGTGTHWSFSNLTAELCQLAAIAPSFRAVLKKRASSSTPVSEP
jgi:hypothetical protein